MTTRFNGKVISTNYRLDGLSPRIYIEDQGFFDDLDYDDHEIWGMYDDIWEDDKVTQYLNTFLTLDYIIKIRSMANYRILII